MSGPWEAYQDAKASPDQKPWEQFASDSEPAKPASAARKLGDLGLGFASGAVGATKALTDAAGAGNAASKMLGSLNEGIGGYLSDEAKADQKAISDGLNDAKAKGLNWEGVKAGAKAFAAAPAQAVAQGLGSVVPLVAGTAFTGGALPAAAVGAGLGIAMGAGTAKGAIYDEIKKRGGTEEQAIKAQEYGGENTDQIALGGVLGAADALTGVSKAATSMMRGAIGKEVAQQAAQGAGSGVLARTAKGVLGEMPLEAAQGGQEQVAANVAAQRAGYEAGTWDNVASNATLEALASAGPGGAFGALGGRGAQAKETPAVPPVTPPAPPAGLLGNTPDPLISFPDGTVGRRSEVDAYVAKLPEDQQPAMRARLMGLAPQPAIPEVAPVAPPSAQMGIDPAAGVLSRVAAEAVDTGTTQEIELNQAVDEEQLAYEQAMAAQDQANAEQDSVDKPITSGPIAEAQMSEEDKRAVLFSNQAVADGGQRHVGTKDGDILNGMGAPFATRMAAARRANLEGKDWTIAPVFDGWVARRKDAFNGASDGVRGSAAGSSEQGGDQPAPSVGLGATTGNGLGADDGGRSNDALGEPRQSAGGADDEAVSNVVSLTERIDQKARDTAMETAVRQELQSQLADLNELGKQNRVTLDDLARLKEIATTNDNGYNASYDLHQLLQAIRKRPAGNIQTEATANVQNPTPAANDAKAEPAPVEAGAPVASAAAPAEGLPGARSAPVEPVGVVGKKLNKQWTAFAPESGTRNIPRAEMPQIRAEHRGAMVNFLNARDISHTQEEVPAASLKPTQAEFSESKVKKALGFTGTDRSILVSSDNHVLDGHHQWMAKLNAGEPVKVIRLNAPIDELLSVVKEFPSATTSTGATPAANASAPASAPVAAPSTPDLDRIAAGNAWFSNPMKAADFITKNGLKETHKSVRTGPKRWDVREKAAVKDSLPVQSERETRIASALANGGHVVGADLRDRTGMRLMGLTPEELKTIPADKVRAKPSAEAARTNSTTKGNEDGTQAAQAQPQQTQPETGADTGISEPAAGAGVAGPTEAVDKPAKKPNKLKQAAQGFAKSRADYFTPGNIVNSYGGQDEVLSYTENDNGGFSVKVHAVRKVGDQWVRQGKPQDARTHSTQPDAKELAKGPVERLGYQASGEVQYSEPRADGKPFPNAVDRGAAPVSNIQTADDELLSQEAIDRIKKNINDPAKTEQVMGDIQKQVDAATPAQREPTEHAGLKIYPVNVKVGDKVEQKWGVQTLNNSEREKKGERQLGGDPLADTLEGAKKLAEQEVESVKRIEAYRAEMAALDDKKKEADAVAQAKKDANKGKSIAERRKDSILDGPTKLHPNAGLGTGTKREAMQNAVEQDRYIQSAMVRDEAAKKRDQESTERARRNNLPTGNINYPGVKEYFEAVARLKADDYTKPEYRVYDGRDTKGAFREISKTEYDYAQELKAKQDAEPETGDFGPIYTGYTNKPKQAIEKLMDEKQGEVADAFIHPELGPIAFIYGDEGKGLRHIEAKRGIKWVNSIPDILRAGRVERDEKGLPRAYIVDEHDPAHVAVIRLDWDGKQKTWLVTAHPDDNGKWGGADKISRTVGQPELVQGNPSQSNPPSASVPTAAPEVKAVTADDVAAAERQALGLIQAAIDKMKAQEAQRFAARFLPTMGVKVPVGKARINAAMTDPKINLLGAADALNVSFAKSIVDTLEAKQEGRVADVADPKKVEKPVAAPIGDFGQKIGGAKKDTWTGFKDDLSAVKDDEIAGRKLSEIWPAPDYQKLIDDGMDVHSVAIIRSLRDEIPAKPRNAYKLSRWADQVQTLRALATNIMNGKDTGPSIAGFLERGNGPSKGIAGRADLYMAVGHDKSLEGIRLAHRHYSLYRGRENVNLWVAERDSGATAFSNWPQELATGDTKEDAIAAFKARYAELDSVAAVKKASFDIITETGKKGFFIGKKIGRNIATLAGPFDTVQEARAYRQSNLAALDEKLAKYKEIPKDRRDTNEPRVGEDMRNGQDVTPEMFAEAFGFKGVEFGNWVEQKRRQKDLNDAYDALMDMAAIMGVPAKAISLNGELGLAFGARGSGGVNPAAAHYESDKIVINLTKREGAGSLGHEWWHAVDNYFSRMRGGQTSPFMTTATDVGLSARGSQYVAYPGVRKEMIDAFGEVVRSIRATAMKVRSSKMDAKRTKEYWTTGEEMAARAFESYLISKLQDQDASNDYLANVVDQKTWDAMAAMGMQNEDSYPYPTAGEMPTIRAGFDKFFQTLETKETEGGNVAMFSRPTFSRGAQSQANESVETIAMAIASNWEGSPEIVVAFDMDDPIIPANVRKEDQRQRSGGATGTPEGFYYKGVVYLMSSELGTPNDVARVLFHEALGHAGLRGAFGGALKPILRDVAVLRRAEVDAKIKQYGLKGINLSDRLVAAEEVLAELAQTRPDIGFVKRAIAAIRTWLRQNVPGFASLRLSDAELIRNYILPARRFVEQGGGPKGGQPVRAEPVFSKNAGMTPEKFRNTYYQTTLRESADVAGILKSGWKSGIGPNVLPAFMGGEPTSVIERRYMPRAGTTVLLVPKSATRDTPNGRKIIDGWKPKQEEIVQVTQDGQSMYEAYAAAMRDGEPMFSRSLGETLSTAANNLVVADVGKKFGNRLADFRGMALQTLGRRQLVDIYAKDLPQLTAYSNMVAQMDADKNESGAEADALATEWGALDERPLGGLAKHPGMERKLAELMHDATLAQIDPDKEFVAGDDADQYQALRDGFEQLSPKAQAAYRKARGMYADHNEKVRQAIRERIERSELSSAKRKALLERMDGEFFQKVKGVYFPLARFGQYLTIVKDSNGTVLNVSRSETLNEADETRKILLKEYPASGGFAVGKVLKEKEFNAARDGVGRGFMSDLFETLEKTEAGEELIDSISQLYLAALPDLSWAKHGIHRKGTPGFSQDARRAFAQNMFHGARYLAKLRYADQLQTHLDDMQEHIGAKSADDGFDSVKAQQVADEMVKRHDSMMNPESHPISTALTSFGFVFHLGLSPASAMVNLSQTALVALPVMGAKWGFGKSSAALLTASKQAANNRNDISKVLKGDELRAYNEAVRSGVIDVTMAHDLAGIAQGEDSKVAAKVRPAMKWASFLFHHAEKFNRQVTFVAAYRLAREAGTEHLKAYADAVKATYDGHFDYSASNRARLLQGNWQKVILLFKQYAQNMIYTLSRQAYQAVKAGTPQERKEARKALGGLLVAHAMAAGVLGLPVVGMLLSAASMVGGDDDEPWDAKVALQNMLADTLGQKPAEVIAHGLSRLTPWDISGRVGLDKLLLPDIQEGLSGTPAAQAMLASAAGPVAGIGVNMVKGLAEIGDGQYQRGFESMLPSALRGPLKAYRFAAEGNIDKTGVPINDEVSAAGIAGQALGLSPSETRLAQEGKSAIYSADRAVQARRSDLMRAYAMAAIDSDAEGMAETREKITRFNEKNPTSRIMPLHLVASVRARRKRIEESKQGVYLPKKRQDAMEAGRFAVVD